MTCQTRSQTRSQTESRAIRHTRSRTKRQTNHHGGNQGQSQARYQIGIRPRYHTRRPAKRLTRRENEYKAKPPFPFNKLPPEIRTMIVEEVIRSPRIIHIDLLAEDPGLYPGYTVKIKNNRIYSQCSQVCPLLGVSRQVRQIAMKEPLIVFDLQMSPVRGKRFHPRSGSYSFAIRRHDFLFFRGSESVRLDSASWGYRTLQIANVIIDLDVRSINYRNPGATPKWMDMISTVMTVTNILRNLECLENVYCLMQNPRTDKKRHFELDDLRELTPGRFPKHARALTTWLEEFGRLYGKISESPFNYHKEEHLKIIQRWRNVTVG
ncbi:hypothetical protein O1611_g7386 [Lasiodiplodia mahajangana]|uniref:Uncharacterized protein n=1 Tax=Lasiodiplodia mahajangana TaxID=1108764 RepID=A0ACC2JFL6_9PEZI|nr:hypothetical protein O1611_g7386 [Lasiodiplodia mahajangana]